MPFDFDTGNPIDTFLIPSYPNNERDFRVDVKAMLEIEHDTAEGRHKFGVGNDAARDAITTWVVGSLWFNTGESPAYIQRVVSVGPVVWENVDARAGIPHLAEQSDFTVTQFASYETITPGAGSPDTCAIDLLTSPYKRVTLVGNTIISNPTNVLGGTGKGATIALDIIQDGSGPWVVTWGDQYLAAGGAKPNAPEVISSTSLVYIRKLHGTTSFVVTTVPDVKAIA